MPKSPWYVYDGTTVANNLASSFFLYLFIEGLLSFFLYLRDEGQRETTERTDRDNGTAQRRDQRRVGQETTRGRDQGAWKGGRGAGAGGRLSQTRRNQTGEGCCSTSWQKERSERR